MSIALKRNVKKPATNKIMMRLNSFLILSCFSFLLTACTNNTVQDDNLCLEGKRISIFDLNKTLSPEQKNPDIIDTVTVKIPPPYYNKEWPQAGGYPHHAMQNLSLGYPIERIWTANIGRGSTKVIPLNVRPVVAVGYVFTLDTNNMLSAFHSQTGRLIWSQNIQSLNEKESVLAGGIAYDNDVLYITSGYNEALAVNPQDGRLIWRQKISAGSRAAPTISNGRVFINAMNNHLITLNASNGKLLWEYEGTGGETSLLGAASPTIDQNTVIAPFSSGNIVALQAENGEPLWEETVSGSSRFSGLAKFKDIRGLPIITKEKVIAVSYSGQMVAFDQNDGHRLWQQQISSRETPWVAGDTIFVLTPSSKILAVNIYDGRLAWTHALPKDDWTGPILAGSKLYVFGKSGKIIILNPKSGEEIQTSQTGYNISIPPIIAEGAMFILSDDGTLSAYR